MLCLTHLYRVDSTTATFWTGASPTEGVYGWILLLPCFIEIPVFNANSEDPDQTRSVSSDLGLHRLSMALSRDARLKWITFYQKPPLLQLYTIMKRTAASYGLKTNGANHDQIPCAIASDLGLHCLPKSILRSTGINGLNNLRINCIRRQLQIETTCTCTTDFYLQSTLIMSTSLFSITA